MSVRLVRVAALLVLKSTGARGLYRLSLFSLSVGFIFDVPIVTTWPTMVPSRWLLRLITATPDHFERLCFLASWRCRPILIFPALRISGSPRSPVKVYFKPGCQNVDVLIGDGSSGVPWWATFSTELEVTFLFDVTKSH